MENGSKEKILEDSIELLSTWLNAANRKDYKVSLYERKLINRIITMLEYSQKNV